MKADIFAVRPPGEDTQDSYLASHKELEGAGLKPSRIVKGITQPDGSTIFNVFLRSDE